MDYGTVSTNTFLALGIMAVWGIGLPVVIAVIWKIKTKASLIPMLVGAIIIHISCSVFVLWAVRESGKWYFFPLAIVCHGLIDVFAGLYQSGVIGSVYVVEVLIAILAVCLAIPACRIYRGMKNEQNVIE